MSTLQYYLSILFIGIASTIFIDIYALVLKKIFKISSLDFKYVGRWFMTCIEGQIFHSNILQSPEKKGEKWVGWIMHYLIGILFVAFFIQITNVNHHIQPHFIASILFGLFTVFFPFFVMQPCFGFGIASAKLNLSYSLRVKSVMTHLFFGLAIDLSTQIVLLFQLQS